jgi:hypothetical protein
LSNSPVRAIVQSFSGAGAVSRRDGMCTDPTRDPTPIERGTTAPASRSSPAPGLGRELTELQAPPMNAIAEGIAQWLPATSREPLGLTL